MVNVCRLVILGSVGLFSAPIVVAAQSQPPRFVHVVVTPPQESGTFDGVSRRVPRGGKLFVTTGSGERISGTLLSVSPDTLLMMVGNDRREMHPPGVQEITYRDPTIVSTIIGFGGGLLAGWGVAARECRVLTLNEIFDDCSDRGSFTFAKTALIVAPLAGALLGWGMDASRNATVFERPSASRVAVSASTDGRRSVGLRATIRF